MSLTGIQQVPGIQLVPGSLFVGAIILILIILVLILIILLSNQKEKKKLETVVKEANEANRLKNIAIRSLEGILNNIDALIYVTVPYTGEILFVNKKMKRLFKVESHDLVGAFCYQVFRNNDHMCDFCPCYQLDKEPDRIIVWDEYIDVLNRHIRHSDSYIDWPSGDKVHLQHAVNITELINAKEQAEQSNRSKSIFLSHMSHEIRTPMNAILGIAEIQLQDKSHSPETEEAFGKIYESGDLLLNIINDILDLSKIESGKLELVSVKYEIPSLINDTAQLIRLRYENKPIIFNLYVDENTPLELIGDELRIKQVLNNVLSNAFKYTDRGKVDFLVSAETGQDKENATLVFCVRDTGQGMTESQIKRLFEEYTRFNLVTNRTTVGAGLGMSITKRLVEMMNGSITVESEPDIGTVFTVRLPQKCAGPEICGAELADRLQNLRFKISSISKKTQYVREYMPYGSVLIVDDVESNIYVTKGMLLPYGLKIDSASSGFDAIERIKSGSVYDIVFMDHMMPGIDGIEAVKNIRDMGYKQPIVALTANALVGQAEMFLQNGFDGFISKPIDSRELNQMLNEFIQNKQPPDVVENARRKHREKELSDLFDQKLSEIEKFFVLDAENALNVLGNMTADMHELSDEEIASYIVTVHGMKSALANIGEKELSGTALELEKAGGERNFFVMSQETPGFINALNALINKFKAVETETETEISSEDKIHLRDKLLGIENACTAFDKRTAKAALVDLKQKTWPRHIKTVLDDITVHILHSEFKKAAAIAKNCLDTDFT